jgi:3-oxoadipate enol-lactonase
MSIHRFTSSDGITLAYEAFGEANIGRPIVLCHGIAASGLQFHDDAEWLAGRGHRVLVPHLRGHGLSGTPDPLTEESLRIPRLAADMIEMLDHSGSPRVHWVGNSLGGIVALEMMAARRFETLATFGTSYSIKLPRVGGHHLIALWHKMLGGGAAAAVTANMTTQDPDARELIDTMLRDARIDVVTALSANLSWYDLIEVGAMATIPILVLRCGRDRLVNVALRDTLAAMSGRPNFRLVELPEGGHVANLDATDAFRAALLEFWTRSRA